MEGKKVPVNFHSPENLLEIEEPESKTVEIEKEKWKEIKKEKGVKAVGVIGFGEIGPYLDTYTHNENSSLLEKLKKDSGLVTELSIIAKHTSEFKTREGEKVLIQPVGNTGNYVLVERSGRKKRKPRALLKKIIKHMKNEEEKPEILKNILKRSVNEPKSSQKAN